MKTTGSINCLDWSSFGTIELNETAFSSGCKQIAGSNFQVDGQQRNESSQLLAAATEFQAEMRKPTVTFFLSHYLEPQ